MAAKKYLSLEEAAERLSMPAEKLNKLRADGDLRGFADRGTWKFKADDIEEYGRSLQVSSDPDVPLLDDPDFDPSDAAAESGSALSGESLEIRLPGQPDVHDDDGLADEPTLVRGETDDLSDSDVRLTVDSGVGDLSDMASQEDDGAIDLSDSDSDVRLVSDESSVMLSGGSDSDVRLIADDGSDSDVALVSDSRGSSAVGASVLDDDQPAGGAEDSQLTLGADSGIMLESPLDSGIALEGSSGVQVGDDDNFSLADESSGIALADDSDVSLTDEDSGSAIALDDGDPGEDGSSIILLGDDSGIALAGDSEVTTADSGIADSGIALDFLNEEDDSPSATQSLAAAGAGAAAGAAAARAAGATEADMEVVDDEGYSVADDEEGGADTSVILFEDDDEDDFGDPSDAPSAASASQFELEEDFDEFESDDASGSVASAEILAEDDDDDLDVFEASDADFEDDDFQSGASRSEFAPAGYARAPEAEFDPVTVSLLGAGTLLLLLVGVLSFDLVRSMWGVNEPGVFSQTILDSIGKSLY